MTTKRYLLFEGEDYSPQGGANDLQGAFETIQEAINVWNKRVDNIWQELIAYYDPQSTRQDAINSYFNGELLWAHIFDLETLKIVWENGNFVAA